MSEPHHLIQTAKVYVHRRKCWVLCHHKIRLRKPGPDQTRDIFTRPLINGQDILNAQALFNHDCIRTEKQFNQKSDKGAARASRPPGRSGPNPLISKAL